MTAQDFSQLKGDGWEKQQCPVCDGRGWRVIFENAPVDPLREFQKSEVAREANTAIADVVSSFTRDAPHLAMMIMNRIERAGLEIVRKAP